MINHLSNTYMKDSAQKPDTSSTEMPKTLNETVVKKEIQNEKYSYDYFQKLNLSATGDDKNESDQPCSSYEDRKLEQLSTSESEEPFALDQCEEICNPESEEEIPPLSEDIFPSETISENLDETK